MNKNLKWGCAIVVLAAVGASAASANIISNVKPVLNIPSLDLLPGQIINYKAYVGPGKPVIGIEFKGDYWDDGVGNGKVRTWWASDLQMKITSPSGNVWIVGGWQDKTMGFSDENWNGWNGSSPGPTAANGGTLPTGAFPNNNNSPAEAPVSLLATQFPWKNFPKDKAGIWFFSFANDFYFGGATPSIKWTNVQISLINIPSPGAISVIGLAGLCALRRRR